VERLVLVSARAAAQSGADAASAHYRRRARPNGPGDHEMSFFFYKSLRDARTLFVLQSCVARAWVADLLLIEALKPNVSGTIRFVGEN
jgi:hypothetical protein